ncbi:hypothetical protein [Chitinophaga qingshengii]|uniref:DUF1795 domain-containing protein n=1 Tax=Chitinophaga qingshengii TaxID=1569794 RepID=A0ABR7THV6_9BACT|nr:hypothetical protein [Chitinophaga qingshengii]MBC9929052.1 hypothetical protein [Chitinophaga qingshengii]
MIKKLSFSILAIAITSCQTQKEHPVTELYNDHAGFCIKAQIPEGWSDDKEIRSFLDENFIFQNVKSTQDHASWMVLQVYEYKSGKPDQFTVDSLLTWHIKEAQVENKTMNVLSRHTQKQSSGKTTGYFDSIVEWDTNTVAYSRVLIFNQGKKIAVLSLHSKGNQPSFQKIANMITASLDY